MTLHYDRRGIIFSSRDSRVKTSPADWISVAVFENTRSTFVNLLSISIAICTGSIQTVVIMFKQLVIVHGGTLAKDVAEQMQLKQPADSQIAVTLRAADSSPKSLVDMGNDSIVCFIMQTIENGAPTEDVSFIVSRSARQLVALFHGQQLTLLPFSQSVLVPLLTCCLRVGRQLHTFL